MIIEITETKVNHLTVENNYTSDKINTNIGDIFQAGRLPETTRLLHGASQGPID